MDNPDAWLEDVKRWYFDEGRVASDQQLPAVQAAQWIEQRRDGPTPAPRPSAVTERPQAN